MRPIFVFGSNTKGRHGKGAALHARDHYGAEYGVGRGRTGHAYAIPTKDNDLRPRDIIEIALDVADFLVYAIEHPELGFQVTRIGCGLAGFTDDEIGPLFKDAPGNCHLPDEWYRYHDQHESGSQPLLHRS